MKKKIVAMGATVAIAALAVGGTLAYFQDSDEATNVMTVGNVKIELHESFVHRGADTAYEDVEGYPVATGGNHSDEQVMAGAGETYLDYLADQVLTPGVSVNKMPYVENTGATDAWVRIKVMIPTALNASSLDSSVICTTALENEFSRPDGTGIYAVDGTYTEDGVKYDVYTFIRNEPLAAGEMTNWNVWNIIKMDDDVTTAELEALIAAGAIDDNGNFNVLVKADAIQATADLDTAAKAWAAFTA